MNMEEIQKFNEYTLETQGAKRVKRSDVKYTGGSTFLWCTRCDFAAKSRTALMKYKKLNHAVSFNSKGSPSTSIALPQHHSTRNNSITEVLLQDNMNITDISDEEVTSDALKYTCLECNFKTMVKNQMDVHVQFLHAGVEADEVNFVCGLCNHKFIDDFNKYVKTHDKPNENVVLIEDLLEENEADDDRNIGTLHEKPDELPSNPNSEKIPEKFKCTKCDLAFTSPVDLKSHEDTHDTGSPSAPDVEPTTSAVIDIEEPPRLSTDESVPETVTCSICKLESKNLDSLKVHIENIHMDNIEEQENVDAKITSQGNETCTKCPHCDILGSKNELEKHISLKHGNCVICGECGNNFPDIKTCEDHMQAKHQTYQHSEPFPCDMCGLVMANFNLLQEHVLNYHSSSQQSDNYLCETCGQNFSDFPSLQSHTHNYHARKKFPCDQCGYETEVYTDLCKHRMTHEGTPGKNILEFMNIIIAQQGLILEQIANSEKRLEKQVKDICMNQKNNSDELNALKKTTMDSKSEITNLVSAKIDDLLKTVSSNNSAKHVPAQDDIKKKEKVLMVGDSLSRNLNISVLQNVTNMEVKRTEAFIVDRNDPKARYPEKNFMKIVPEELKKDGYSTLILQGGTNEVSNLDTTGNVVDKIEARKEEIKVSSEKLFIL